VRRVCAFLRDHDFAQSPAASGGIQDGRSIGRWTSKNGRSPAEHQRQVSRHHDRLSADTGLRKSRKQGEGGAAYSMICGDARWGCGCLILHIPYMQDWAFKSFNGIPLKGKSGASSRFNSC